MPMMMMPMMMMRMRMMYRSHLVLQRSALSSLSSSSSFTWTRMTATTAATRQQHLATHSLDHHHHQQQQQQHQHQHQQQQQENHDRSSSAVLLAIETTCDETGVALLSSQGEILADALASQWHIHKAYRGIVPHLAAREHESHLPMMIRDVLERGGITQPECELSAIAIARGPGLAPCLRAGMHCAQSLARQWQLPLVGVNHLEAHALVTHLHHHQQQKHGEQEEQLKQDTPVPDSSSPPPPPPPPASRTLRFPHLTLLVSGGHTQLWLSRDIGDHQILGTTVDDACGEAFDKVARLIEITELASEPGGGAVERIATGGGGGGGGDDDADVTLTPRGDPYAFDFPIAMTHPKRRQQQQQQQRREDSSNGNDDGDITTPPQFNFSFSGLKTAVRRRVRMIQAEQAPHCVDFDQSRPGQWSSAQVLRGTGSIEDREALRLSPRTQADLAASFQYAVVQQLVRQTQRALRWCQKELDACSQPTSVVLCGGVACNRVIREALTTLAHRHSLAMFVPPPQWCGDNAVMIGWTAMQHWLTWIADAAKLASTSTSTSTTTAMTSMSRATCEVLLPPYECDNDATTAIGTNHQNGDGDGGDDVSDFTGDSLRSQRLSSSTVIVIGDTTTATPTTTTDTGEYQDSNADAAAIPLLMSIRSQWPI